MSERRGAAPTRLESDLSSTGPADCWLDPGDALGRALVDEAIESRRHELLPSQMKASA